MREPVSLRKSALTLGRFALSVAAVAAATAVAGAAEPAPAGHEYNPPVAVATPDAARAIASFRKPAGWSVELFAAEPLLANPVAFGFDEKGQVYVVETFRLKNGVTDNRAHMSWLDDDLASRTVADRVAMYRKHLGKEAESWAVEHDRIRLVEDRDGDGKADHASVFADGFKDLETGLAAGVLARKGDVYFTCIPDLWRLRDADGDGKADVRDRLHTGFGVHVAFLGHDLHGLKFGPDGRLYFSIGDRGLNVPGVASVPDTGSVLRCEPDGSHLEIFATGLRNPQELAFDESGNLFTVDNNSDSGDKARLVYVVEGGDSGWRVGYQYLDRPVTRGPWNHEKLWHPLPENQAAYLLPPLANLSDGPSGLVYNPGSTRLPGRYQRHFFLADFRGGPGASGIRAFSVRPEGASFALADSEELLWGVLPTDVDFGPDGALYLTDWVNGWDTTGKGRIYRLFDPATPAAAANEVKSLLASGFTKLPNDRLKALLAHPDQRVRQEAQFELADRASAPRGERSALAALTDVAAANPSRVARLHAVWGLGQVARKSGTALNLVGLCGDPDAEVRAQAVKALGEVRWTKTHAAPATAAAALRTLLRDASPRVRFFAAQTLGKSNVATSESAGLLLSLLRDNADRDVYLRHAAVTGLAALGRTDELLAASADRSPSVRLGVVLALRRLGHPEVARFLDDADPRVSVEAARAIYDTPIDPALPRLAAPADRRGLPEPLLRRVVQANARVAGAESARRLAQMAGRADLPEPIRVEAVEALAGWPKALGRDRLTGLWRPSPARPSSEAAAALNPVVPGLLDGASEAVRVATLRATGPLPLEAAVPASVAFVADRARPVETRVEALRALDRLDAPRLGEAVKRAVDDPAPALRVEGQRLLARLRPSDALPVLTRVLETGTIRERQGAFASLGAMAAGTSDALLCLWLDRLKAGKLPADVELDLLEAARRRGSPEVARRLGALDASRSASDPVDAFRETLTGGDASRGESLFNERAEISCVRCHKVRGRGGEVGPDLTGVGTRHDRRYLLESLVAPNRQIAKGFETLLVATSDGSVHSGILKDSAGPSLTLITAEGKLISIPKADIEDQKRGSSAMPEDLTKRLTRAELRDLVEFLSALK